MQLNSRARESAGGEREATAATDGATLVEEEWGPEESTARVPLSVGSYAFLAASSVGDDDKLLSWGRPRANLYSRLLYMRTCDLVHQR